MRIRQLWYRFLWWLAKDIIQEELTEALHPDFGYVWREPNGQGYKYILQAKAEGAAILRAEILNTINNYPTRYGEYSLLDALNHAVERAIRNEVVPISIRGGAIKEDADTETIAV